jgi:hypothetical protein
MTIPWGTIIDVGLQAGSAYMSAKGAKKAGKKAVQQSTPVPYGTNSMWGSTTVDPKTKQISYNQSVNPFSQILNQGGMQSFANAFAAPGQAYYGAAPEIAQAAAAMGGPQQEAEAAERLGLLRGMAQPGEQRQSNSLLDRLQAMGRLGGTGGAVEQEALASAQAQADLQRQMTAQDWATNRATNRFNTALGAVGAGQSQASQSFNFGQNSMQGIAGIFQQLLAQGQQGVGSAAGTPASVALGNAGASQAWPNALGQIVSNAGIGDAIGGWLNKTPTATPSATVPTPSTGSGTQTGGRHT